MNRAPLCADTIFRAALALVDAEGIEALTMRHLATELDVATMSLYSHVANKDDVLLGVVNVATAEIALPDPATAPWDALRVITREFRRVALRHPNLVRLIMTRPPSGVEGLRTLEAAFDALARAGVGPADRARAYRLMSSFAIGFVSLEVGGYFMPPDAGNGKGNGRSGRFGAGARVAPRDIPRILETIGHLADWDADAEFEAGMTVVIESLVRPSSV